MTSALATTQTIDMDAMRENAGRAASYLKGLANERRLMILCNLVDGEKSVGELNDHVPLSQSALSQHLAVLREQGLVTSRREAKNIFYALGTGGPAVDIIRILHEAFCPPERRC